MEAIAAAAHTAEDEVPDEYSSSSGVSLRGNANTSRLGTPRTDIDVDVHLLCRDPLGVGSQARARSFWAAYGDFVTTVVREVAADPKTHFLWAWTGDLKEAGRVIVLSEGVKWRSKELFAGKRDAATGPWTLGEALHRSHLAKLSFVQSSDPLPVWLDVSISYSMYAERGASVFPVSDETAWFNRTCFAEGSLQVYDTLLGRIAKTRARGHGRRFVTPVGRRDPVSHDVLRRQIEYSLDQRDYLHVIRNVLRLHALNEGEDAVARILASRRFRLASTAKALARRMQLAQALPREGLLRGRGAQRAAAQAFLDQWAQYANAIELQAPAETQTLFAGAHKELTWPLRRGGRRLGLFVTNLLDCSRRLAREFLADNADLLDVVADLAKRHPDALTEVDRFR